MNNNNQQLVAYVVGGVIVIVVLYPLREYLVLALVGAGAIYLYKLVDESNRRNRRR